MTILVFVTVVCAISMGVLTGFIGHEITGSLSTGALAGLVVGLPLGAIIGTMIGVRVSG